MDKLRQIKKSILHEAKKKGYTFDINDIVYDKRVNELYVSGVVFESSIGKIGAFVDSSGVIRGIGEDFKFFGLILIFIKYLNILNKGV